MVYDTYQKLRVDLDKGVAWVTIDNPPINLFDLDLYGEMQRIAADLAGDDAVHVVVLRSANPEFFIAHFDVSVILALPTDLPPPTEANAFHVMCETFRTMPKATIAMVEGRAGGGGSELALSCDMRFAALGRAVFSQPEVALGIIPGGTGTQRLGRLAGRSRALEIVLGCGEFDAATAERYGWINRALFDGELEPFVRELAEADRIVPTARGRGRQGCGAQSREGGRRRPPGRGGRVQRDAGRRGHAGDHAALFGYRWADQRGRAPARRARQGVGQRPLAHVVSGGP